MRVLTSLLCLGVALPMCADHPKDFTWAQAQAGLITPQNDPRYSDSLGYGFGMGTWFNKRVGMELSIVSASLRARSDLVDARHDNGDLSLLVALGSRPGAWVPYVRVGAGATYMEAPLSGGSGPSTRGHMLVGLGAQALFSRNGIASLELRHSMALASGSRRELEVMGGIGLRWGGTHHHPPVVVEVLPATPEPEPVQAPVVQETVTLTPIVPPTVARDEVLEALKAMLQGTVLRFENNSARVSLASVEELKIVAGRVLAYKGPCIIEVAGHTSSPGSTAHNMKLSKRRAEAVAKELAESGIPKDRIVVKWFGEDKPVADNATKEGQAQNRRVELAVGQEKKEEPEKK